jgi:hypothetical protein
MKSPGCPNKACPPGSAGASIPYRLYHTSSGKHCRYRCLGCAKTFCANKGTPTIDLSGFFSIFQPDLQDFCGEATIYVTKA